LYDEQVLNEDTTAAAATTAALSPGFYTKTSTNSPLAA